MQVFQEVLLRCLVFCPVGFSLNVLPSFSNQDCFVKLFLKNGQKNDQKKIHKKI